MSSAFLCIMQQKDVGLWVDAGGCRMPSDAITVWVCGNAEPQRVGLGTQGSQIVTVWGRAGCRGAPDFLARM